MAECYRFRVSGRVQGVFFRKSTQAQAEVLGLRGWVRNAEDGGVEGLASGSAEALASFHAWLHRGPPAAAVTAVHWEPAAAPDGDRFTICR